MFSVVFYFLYSTLCLYVIICLNFYYCIAAFHYMNLLHVMYLLMGVCLFPVWGYYGASDILYPSFGPHVHEFLQGIDPGMELPVTGRVYLQLYQIMLNCLSKCLSQFTSHQPCRGCPLLCIFANMWYCQTFPFLLTWLAWSSISLWLNLCFSLSKEADHLYELMGQLNFLLSEGPFKFCSLSNGLLVFISWLCKFLHILDMSPLLAVC